MKSKTRKTEPNWLHASLLGCLMAMSVATSIAPSIAEVEPKMRKITFDDTVPIGFLVVHGHGHPIELGQARKTVFIPSGSLELRATPELLTHPEILDKLPADLFDEIRIDKIQGDLTALIPHLVRFKKLTRLEIMFSELNDKQAAQLAALRELVSLDLRCGQITGSCFHALKSLPHLRVLHIGANRFLPKYISELAEMPAVDDLEVSSCTLTNEDLAAIAKGGRLRFLTISANSKISGKGLAALKNCKNLWSIDMRNDHLNANDILSLKSSPSLSSFSAPGLPAADEKKVRAAFPKVHITFQEFDVDEDTKIMFAPLH